MTESFIAMYDLESLTEPQRQQYLKALCQHLGVPDNLNLVALTRLDDGEGPARLVAYVKRGGAEAIRNNLKLDVKSLTNQMVGGSIVFTAIGVDKNGRQEIAVGSKYIDGLTGSQLDDSVMTASTRALRRLALQFAASGVLDESEVNQRKTIHVTSALAVAAPQPTVAPSSEPGKDITKEDFESYGRVQTIVLPAAELTKEQRQEIFEKGQAQLRADAIAQLNAATPAEPQPTVAPSSEPGKDVTPQPNIPDLAANHALGELAKGLVTPLTPLQELQKQPDHDMQKCVESNVPCGNIVHDIGKFTVVDVSESPYIYKTQEEFEAAQAKLRADAIAQLNATAKPEPIVEAPKKTRKPRGPNKKKVDLGPSELPKADIKPDIPALPKIDLAPDVDTRKSIYPPTTEQPNPAINPATVATSVSTKPRLTPDQVKPFRQRLFRIVNDYLEPNGFAPKEGIGNADKMRALANVMFPEVTNMNQLGEPEWEKYLTVLESKIKTEGPAATVKYIEESIGL